jgi:hypothetical protein
MNWGIEKRESVPRDESQTCTRSSEWVGLVVLPGPQRIPIDRDKTEGVDIMIVERLSDGEDKLINLTIVVCVDGEREWRDGFVAGEGREHCAGDEVNESQSQ